MYYADVPVYLGTHTRRVLYPVQVEHIQVPVSSNMCVGGGRVDRLFGKTLRRLPTPTSAGKGRVKPDS